MTEIDTWLIRLTPERFARWQRESNNYIQQQADGSLAFDGDLEATVDAHGRLFLSCSARHGPEFDLIAESGEWSQV